MRGCRIGTSAEEDFHGGNGGCVYINFVDHESAVKAAALFHGFRWKMRARKPTAELGKEYVVDPTKQGFGMFFYSKTSRVEIPDQDYQGRDVLFVLFKTQYKKRVPIVLKKGAREAAWQVGRVRLAAVQAFVGARRGGGRRSRQRFVRSAPRRDPNGPVGGEAGCRQRFVRSGPRWSRCVVDGGKGGRQRFVRSALPAPACLRCNAPLLRRVRVL